MLYAREVPKTGGDTLFASIGRAEPTLEGLKALHKAPTSSAPRGSEPGPDWGGVIAKRT
jgi:alpha-ketoglutarate-dependent taurine dioxygenase